jgi:hypothetical protein
MVWLIVNIICFCLESFSFPLYLYALLKSGLTPIYWILLAYLNHGNQKIVITKNFAWSSKHPTVI